MDNLLERMFGGASPDARDDDDDFHTARVKIGWHPITGDIRLQIDDEVFVLPLDHAITLGEGILSCATHAKKERLNK